MWFFIILGLLILLITAVSIIKKKQNNYVYLNSTKLAAVKELTKQYTLGHKFQRDFRFRFYLDVKRKFDNFRYEDAIYKSFVENQSSIKHSITQVTIERLAFIEYKEKLAQLPETNLSALPKSRLVSEKKFTKLEDLFISANSWKPNLSLSLTVKWSYTSPKGQNYYEDERTLDYQGMVNRYIEYFGVDLTKIEENNKLEQAVNFVKESMVDIAYSIPQIIALFKKAGIAADEKLAMTTASQAGFLRQRKSEVYIKGGAASVYEMILLSANSNGLIHYNNSVKNDEYDDAIAKLEKDGKIVPISNLLFLKVDVNLDYGGITLNEIKTFFEELEAFAEENRYISVKTVVDNIASKITKADFEECFVYSLMKYSGFLKEIPRLNKLFTKDETPTRLAFLTMLMEPYKSTNVFDLIVQIKDKYDVDYNIYSIIYDIDKGKTKLYYNSETEKLYSDKEYFYEEIL